MKGKLIFRRVLLLSLIVVALSALYMMLHREVIRGSTRISNPALLQAMERPSAEPVDAAELMDGYLVIWNPQDPVSEAVRPAVDLALGCLGLAGDYRERPDAMRIREEKRGIIVALSDLSKLRHMDVLLMGQFSSGSPLNGL